MVFLDELGGGHQVLWVGEHELARERTQVCPKSPSEPLSFVLVALGQ